MTPFGQNLHHTHTLYVYPNVHIKSEIYFGLKGIFIPVDYLFCSNKFLLGLVGLLKATFLNGPTFGNSHMRVNCHVTGHSISVVYIPGFHFSARIERLKFCRFMVAFFAFLKSGLSSSSEILVWPNFTLSF